MACILKLPTQDRIKGIVTFTTGEYSEFISKSPLLNSMIFELKKNWIIGLHHNSAHKDHNFYPDPVFDFHIAGRGDISDPQNRPFLQIEMDCSNFCPTFFEDKRTEKDKFWDVLFISRNVNFKNPYDLLLIARKLLDKKKVRILAILTHEHVHKKNFGPSKIMRDYIENFTPEERKYFTLMTPSLDYPFPYDLETLAHFYQHSKIFLHTAKKERHPRVVAYAWASGLPVVSNIDCASLLPDSLQNTPGLFEYSSIDKAVEHILNLLEKDLLKENMDEYINYHLIERSIPKFKNELQNIYSNLNVQFSDDNWILNDLDIRLARHHMELISPNTINQSLENFVNMLKNHETIIQPTIDCDYENIILKNEDMK